MNKPVMLTSPKEVELNQELNTISEDYLIRMQKKKEQIIKEKLKAINKLTILRDYNKKRFKKLMIENHPDKEVVYIDNGTIRGQRLVTFIKFTELEIKDKQFKWQLKYF